MAGPKREVTRQRELLVWELRTRSLNQYQIADAVREAGLGRMSQQAVAAMLRRIETRVLAELSERVATEKAFQHESYELLKKEAWDQWERSKRNAVMVKTKASKIEVGHGREKIEAPSEEVTRTVKGRLADPRYLDAIIKANAAQARLWGLDALPTDPPAGQGAPDPEAARRALMAAAGEPPITADDDEDDHPEAEETRP